MRVLLSTLTRNKKGQISRTDQTLTADVLHIGRGTDCPLFLPDPRISLITPRSIFRPKALRVWKRKVDW